MELEVKNQKCNENNFLKIIEKYNTKIRICARIKTDEKRCPSEMEFVMKVNNAVNRRNMFKWMQEITLDNSIKAMPILTFPAVSMHDFCVREAVCDGYLQYKLMKTVADRYPEMIASLSMMDLSVEAEAFGASIVFPDDELPTITGRLIDDIEDVRTLQIPEVGTARTKEYIKAVELAAAEITDRPVFAGCIGPFSLAGRLLDMCEIMTQTILEPELTHLLLEKCTTFIIRYIEAFKAVGANGIVMAEPAAGLLSQTMCTEFSSRYVKQIVDAVQDESFLVILHNCGKTEDKIASLVSTGAKCYHFGNCVDMRKILPQIPWGSIAMGNLDPSACFRMSDPQGVGEKTTELLYKLANYRNFVISSGCDIPPDVRIENTDAFFEAVRSFNHENFIKIA